MAWLVVPTYVWYCMSVEQIVSPPRAVAAQFTAWWDAAKQTWTARAVLGAGILFTMGAFILCGRTMRERVYKLAVIVATLGGLFVLCWVCFFLYERQHGGSVWMPRYLGFAWPAVAIAVAALLLRLPTRPLRWSAIALLVGVNLAVYSARLFAGSEPPVDRMARDLVDAQPPSTMRMYYDVGASRGGPPGAGTLYTLPGAYYLTIYSGKPSNPQEFLTGFAGGRIASKFKRWNRPSFVPLPQYVASDANKTPALTRLIVWEDFTPRESMPADDAVLQRLGHNWKRTGEEIFHVRDHWTWRNLLTLRRRVYERAGPVPTTVPATLPTTAPATTPR